MRLKHEGLIGQWGAGIKDYEVKDYYSIECSGTVFNNNTGGAQLEKFPRNYNKDFSNILINLLEN